MKTALIVFVALFCRAAWCLSGYYAVVDHAELYRYPLYQGFTSRCFALPSMAINSLLSTGMKVQRIEREGNWLAHDRRYGDQYTYSGRYYTCSHAGFGPLPEFANGSFDPVLANVDSPNPASTEYLQNTVAELQAALAMQQGTLTGLTNAQAEKFELRTALAAFSFFFGSILTLWSVAKGGGLVLSAIRQRW